MADGYFEKRDLADFPHIGEWAPACGEAFFSYYGVATGAGALSEREKGLIALAMATAGHCPYCIDAYTTRLLSLGVGRDEMMEAVHVAAAMQAGMTLAHATQVRKIVKQKEL